MVELYHFTSRQGWTRIEAAGEITPLYPREQGEPPIPRTVHLSSNASGAGLSRGISREVRITVDLSGVEVLPHLEWVNTLPPASVPSLTGKVPLYVFGEQEDPNTWFVVAQAISADRWRVVVDTESGVQLWP